MNTDDHLFPDDPATVGPYRIEKRLGSGGQGVVYAGRAHDGPLVAIKLLHPHLVADGLARERFLREVETAKRVAPFCTAQLLDSGFAWTRPYIVSEYVPGPSLQSSVRDDGPRGAAALHRLAINTATALAAIHAAGVVHRDFKPANVLLGPDGPVVIDFGIAKALDQSQSVISSQPFGSPAYMAPEQISNGDVGPPADLFAWAATMYYAATGRRAFLGDGIPATLHAVLSSEPDLSPVDERLRWLLRDCLAKDPSRRPTSGQVVDRLRALTGVTDRPSPTTPPPAPATSAGPLTPPQGFLATSPPSGPPTPAHGFPATSSPSGPLTPPHGLPAASPPNGPLTPPHGFPATSSGPGVVPGARSDDTAPRAEARGAALGTGPVTGGGRMRVLKVGVPVGAVALIAAAGIGWHTLSPAVSRPEAVARVPVPAATERTPEPTPTTSQQAQEAKDLASATSRPKTATPTTSRRRPTSTSPSTSPSTVPATTAERTPSPSATTTTRRPATRTPKPTPKPTRSPTAKRSTSAPAPEPSTGTITWTDVNAYCKAKGYKPSYSAGWGYTRCNGSDSAVDPASVCRWKYPDYPNATAETPANPWMPTATCQLS
ncbi:protein kinase [Nonomuraea sp. NPDC004580]|uniref:serine/threonine protein kinase n=1 Tax=Nonomuraea sp. NPDC004580 TaxID=3154552 RepID=UPI00339DF42F